MAQTLDFETLNQLLYEQNVSTKNATNSSKRGKISAHESSHAKTPKNVQKNTDTTAPFKFDKTMRLEDYFE